jgi:hypothetical protein
MLLIAPAAAAVVVAAPASATTSAQMSISPLTGLENGTIVTFYSSPGELQADSPGIFVECDATATQPVATFYAEGESVGDLPVSCALLGQAVTSPMGSILASLPVQSGTPATSNPLCDPASAPGCTGVDPTDSSGNSTLTDAASYPCAAQCELGFADAAGDAISDPAPIDPPMSLSASIPAGTVDTPYSGAQVTAVDDTPPLVWHCTTCASQSWNPAGDPFVVAPGLHFTPATGTISGTPTQAGTYSFTLSATDESRPTRQTATQQETLVVNPTATTVSVSVRSALLMSPGDGGAKETIVGGVPEVTYGRQVKLIARYGPRDGIPRYSGAVTFTADGSPLACNNGSTLGAPTRTTLDKATCVTNAGALGTVGDATVTASLGGDSNFTAESGSTQVAIEAVPPAGLEVRTDARGPVTQGSSVTYTATMRPRVDLLYAEPPTGNVTFSIGSTTLCSAPLAVGQMTLSASCPATNAPVGKHEVITASYAGDTNWGAASGSGRISVSGPSSNVRHKRHHKKH